jgi:Tol biopolymer transport system component
MLMRGTVRMWAKATVGLVRCGGRLAMLGSAALLQIGCRPHSSESAVQAEFSPDSSRWVSATVRSRSAPGLPNPGGPKPLSETAMVQWVDTAAPGKVHSVLVGSEESRGRGIDVMFRLSPDGRRIVVCSQGRLKVIDLQTEQMRILSAGDGIVTSMAWRGNRELVYAEHLQTPETPGHFGANLSQRTVCRLEVDGPARAPLVVLRQHHIKGAIANGRRYDTQEVWSPDGRHAVLKSSTREGRLQVLDVDCGSTFDIETPVISLTNMPSRITWKTDGSAVAYIGEAATGEPTGLKIDLATKAVVDFSQSLRRSPPIDGITVEPLWTPDGEFILLNAYRASTGTWGSGGFMVRTSSWQCTSMRDAGADPTDGQVHWVPTPGLVQVDAELQDYAGHTVLRLASSDDRVSADGRWIGTTGSPQTMQLRPSGMQRMSRAALRP